MEAEVVDRPELLPPLTLAYVGDAVYELYVRQYLLVSGKIRVKGLHEAAVSYVRAGAQAAVLRHFSPELTELEQEVVRRGRNAKGQNPRRIDPAEYAMATAFEALVGYLHLAGHRERLERLLAEAVHLLESAT